MSGWSRLDLPDLGVSVARANILRSHQATRENVGR
jgi:hypothetical protein